MAQIVLTFDTETKEASATVDGKTVENFCYGSMSAKMGDYNGYCSVESRSVKDGMTKTECVYASDKNMGLANRLKGILK